MGRKREISVISSLAVAGAAFGGTVVTAPSASAASITISASGSDVVAINPAVFSGAGSYDMVSGQMAEILSNSARYLGTTWYTSTYNGVASDGYLNLEYKLEVWDSPNSAGVIIDAVRCAKIALDRGIGGPILSASSYFMKSPPVQYFDDQARQAVQDFIDGTVER